MSLLSSIDRATGMDACQAYESAFKLCRGEGPEVAALVAAINGREQLPLPQQVGWGGWRASREQGFVRAQGS
jgi:hypothetical protein